MAHISGAAREVADHRASESLAAQAIDALRVALGDQLIAAVLFGSQARGDGHDGSDWDVLIVAEALPERIFERHIFLKRLLPANCRAAVSIIARTPTEFEARLPSLYLDIALDGRILYDPRGYAEARLASLQGLMNSQGLFRERTPDGDVWRRKKPHAGPWQLQWGE